MGFIKKKREYNMRIMRVKPYQKGIAFGIITALATMSVIGGVYYGTMSRGENYLIPLKRPSLLLLLLIADILESDHYSHSFLVVFEISFQNV